MQALQAQSQDVPQHLGERHLLVALHDRRASPKRPSPQPVPLQKPLLGGSTQVLGHEERVPLTPLLKIGDELSGSSRDGQHLAHHRLDLARRDRLDGMDPAQLRQTTDPLARLRRAIASDDRDGQPRLSGRQDPEALKTELVGAMKIIQDHDHRTVRHRSLQKRRHGTDRTLGGGCRRET